MKVLADRQLAIGDRISVPVPARRYWSPTHVRLTAGQVYELNAVGTWRDFLATSGPDGYETPWYSPWQRLAERWRRMPQARWFALIGAIRDDQSEPFVIGSNLTMQAQASGPLECYANDVPGFYFNNLGSVELTVTHTR
jgi:hypothetical protein